MTTFTIKHQNLDLDEVDASDLYVIDIFFAELTFWVGYCEKL